jgi:hypothetical protein
MFATTKLVLQLHRMQELPIDGPPAQRDPFEFWVQEQYYIYCVKGSKMVNAKKIVAIFLPMIPPHLSNQSSQLVSTVCKILERMGVPETSMKKVAAQRWLQSQPTAPRQKSLQEWVDEEYIRHHSAKTSAAKITSVLSATLPQHLRGQSTHLRAAVDAMLQKKAATTAPSGAGASGTTPVTAHSVSARVVEGTKASSAAVHSSGVLQRHVVPQKPATVSAPVQSGSHLSISSFSSVQQPLNERPNGGVPVGGVKTEEVPRPEPVIRRNAKVIGTNTPLPYHSQLSEAKPRSCSRGFRKRRSRRSVRANS